MTPNRARLLRALAFCASCLLGSACSGGPSSQLQVPNRVVPSAAVSPSETSGVSMPLSGSRMIIKSIKLRDRDGKPVQLPMVMKPGQSIRDIVTSAREQWRSNRKHRFDGNQSAITNDVCYSGGSVPVIECGIQDYTAEVDWELDPQPPDGIIATYTAQGLPSSLYSSNTLTPSTQSSGPYETTQLITFTTNAQTAMDYVDTLSTSCISTIPNYTQTCNPGSAGLGVVCNQPEQHCPYVQITDNLQSMVVASPAPVGAPSTTPGLEQNLTASIKGGSESFSTVLYDWTPEDANFLSYEFDNSTGLLSYPTQDQLTAQTLDFYWQPNATSAQIDEDSIGVRSDGQEITLPEADAVYNLEEPTLSLTVAVPTMTVYKEAGCSLTGACVYGLALGSPTDEIIYTIGGKMSQDFGGFVGMNQLIKTAETYSPTSSRPADITNTNGLELDTCPIYPGVLDVPPVGDATPMPVGSVAATQMYKATEAFTDQSYQDSPGIDISNTSSTNSVTYSGNIVDTVMYKPVSANSSANSLWVPFGNVSFSWNGTAVLYQPLVGSQGYELQNPQAQSQSLQTSSSTVAFPHYTSNVDPGGAICS